MAQVNTMKRGNYYQYRFEIATQADPAHIFTPEEIEIIFNRFRNSHIIYYAFLTHIILDYVYQRYLD